MSRLSNKDLLKAIHYIVLLMSSEDKGTITIDENYKGG